MMGIDLNIDECIELDYTYFGDNDRSDSDADTDTDRKAQKLLCILFTYVSNNLFLGLLAGYLTIIT